MWRLELLNLQLLSLGLGGLGLGTGWLFEGVLQDLYTSLSVGLSSSLSNSAWHAWHACWASPAGTLFLDWVSDHRVKLRHISSYKLQRVQLQLVVTTPCETHELQRSASRRLSLFCTIWSPSSWQLFLSSTCLAGPWLKRKNLRKLQVDNLWLGIRKSLPVQKYSTKM